MQHYVGQSVTRSGVQERVTGKLLYAGDLRLPGMLHAKLVTLNCSRARIIGIDTSAAEKLAGVRCVLTAASLPQPMPRFGPVERDRPVLATGETKYFGEPVAAVAAERADIAAAAAKLVKVDYVELPAVCTLEQALAPGAPLVQDPSLRPDSPWRDTNIYGEWHYQWGNAAAASAELVLDRTYRFPMQVHFAIEPHVFIAAPDGPDGLIVWSTVQHPFVLRQVLAETVGLPAAKVRVVATEVGGGFGGKGYPKFEPLVAFLALKTQRPVRLALSLTESFLVARRASCVARMRTGFSADGRLVFQHAQVDYLIGPYADITARIVSKAGYIGCGPYWVPNLDVTARAIFSHIVPATAYRGFGAPQYLWAVESQMDAAARELGIDRVQIRLRNLPPKGSTLVPGDTPVDGDWRQGLQMAAQAIGWGKPLTARRGRGVAIGIKSPRSGSASQAIVRLHHDGSATVLVGTTELGQGSQTVFAQIAADALGIPVARVRVVAGDTAFVPFDAITASSRSTVCMGNAILAACQEVKNRLATIAAAQAGVSPASVTVSKGQIHFGAQSWAYADVIRARYGPGEGEIVGVGEYQFPRDEQHPLGGPVPFWEVIFVGAEVEVDAETGQYRVIRLATVADIGKAINPAQAEGQDEGGAMMSLGHAMMEHLVLDERGVPLNLGPLDYRIPTAMDVPEEVISLLMENEDGPGPFGAKGVGESGAIAVGPAVASALAEATGASFSELPITPERVWRALRVRRPQVAAEREDKPAGLT